jgi:hypothetical protein
MRRMGAIAAGAVMLVMVGACASTKFTSTWKDPSVGQLAFKGRAVAAFFVTSNESLRRSGETALANELEKRGMRARRGYEILGADEVKSADALRAKLKEAAVDGAVVMRVIDRRQEVNYVPGTGPYAGTLDGYWGYGWGAVYDPGYLTTDTIVSVETLVYSVPRNKLVWAGVSETIDPDRIDSAIQGIVDQAAKAMKKDGLIGK